MNLEQVQPTILKTIFRKDPSFYFWIKKAPLLRGFSSYNSESNLLCFAIFFTQPRRNQHIRR
jgi:hypothetical protein